MSKTPILYPYTAKRLQQYLARPGQTLMLTGNDGVGLHTVARYLAAEIASTNTIDISPSLHDKQKTAIINADDISQLFDIVRDRRSQPLVIIIDDADNTAPGVFERILKIIEEPVANLHYIFTTHHVEQIPPTILSRSATITVLPPLASGCRELYDSQPAVKQSQLKFLAERLPASLSRLLNSEDQFNEQVSYMEMAKLFVSGSAADRLRVATEIKTRPEAITVVSYIAKLSDFIGSSQANHATAGLARRLSLIVETSNNLSANGNVKLQLLNLAINF